MYPALSGRMARRTIPAGLVVLGLVLEGCAERQAIPLSPTEGAIEGPTADVAFRVEKERSAADLGPPAAPGHSTVTALSVSAYGPTTTSIPFAPEAGPFAYTVPPCDDCLFNGVPIGFGFTFFGNTYTTFNLSTNGFIGFSPAGDGCCAGHPIPAADALNNIIAAAWTDLYPPGGGGVFFETRGRAPRRYLVVAYAGVPWCCGSGDQVDTQIILYEGTNVIEIHTAHQSAGHIYTQGVEDASGTRAAFVPGRVAANYELVNDAVRFTTVLGSWAPRASLPSPRQSPAVTAANGLLYSIGGLTTANVASASTYAYDPSTNAWSSKASLPAAREGGNGSAAIGRTIYLAGGYNAAGELTRTLYAYNTSTNTWATRADMPVVSACGGSAAISGKLYVFSGCRLSSTGVQTPAGSLHQYDPNTNLWTTLSSAPSVHIRPAVGVIGGKLYVVGGNIAAGTPVSRLEVYDPATNAWATKASMPTGRVAAAAAVVGGRLHVIGGRNGDNYLRVVEAYDPITDTWSVRAPMPAARAGHGVGKISSLVYAVGGRVSSTTLVATSEMYAP